MLYTLSFADDQVLWLSKLYDKKITNNETSDKLIKKWNTLARKMLLHSKILLINTTKKEYKIQLWNIYS